MASAQLLMQINSVLRFVCTSGHIYSAKFYVLAILNQTQNESFATIRIVATSHRFRALQTLYSVLIIEHEQ